MTPSNAYHFIIVFLLTFFLFLDSIVSVVSGGFINDVLLINSYELV